METMEIMTTVDVNDILSVEAAAKLLGCTTVNIRNLTRKGHLTPLFQIKRQRFYHRSEVLRAQNTPLSRGRPKK